MISTPVFLSYTGPCRRLVSLVPDAEVMDLREHTECPQLTGIPFKLRAHDVHMTLGDERGFQSIVDARADRGDGSTSENGVYRE